MHDRPNETAPEHDSSGRINSADIDESTLEEDRDTKRVYIKPDAVGDTDILSVYDPSQDQMPMKLKSPKTGEYEQAVRIDVIDKAKNKFQFYVPESCEEEAIDQITKFVDLGAIFGGATPSL